MKVTYLIITAVVTALVSVIGTTLVTKSSVEEGVVAQQPTASPVSEDIPTITEQGKSVASLGKVSLREGEVTDWLAGLNPQARAAMREKNRSLFDDWARRRLAEKALVREARQQGWEKREEVARAIKRAEEQILLRGYLSAVSQPPEGYPDEETLRQVFDASKEELQLPTRYHLRQIFLAADEGDAATVKARAEQLVKEGRGGQDFSELARRHSGDATSAAKGGDIGKQSLAQLMPQARPIVSDLKEGEVSEPFQTASGWHVLKLEKKEAARAATFEEVRERLSTTLRTQRRRQNAEAYLNRVVGEASLSIDGAAITALLEKQNGLGQKESRD